MGRSARGKRPPALPKVERVELSGKHMGLRFTAFALCLTLGLCALGFGIYSLLSAEPGWAQIEASNEEAYVAGDLSFSYLLEENATAQRKALTTLYTQQCTELGKLFDPTRTYEDCPNNLCYINTHPGEEIKVDPRLYEAFQRLEAAGDRTVYLGVLEAYYLNLYYNREDIRSGKADPFTDPDSEELFKELEGFAKTGAQLELLGDDSLCLKVSPEYAELAGELGLDCYLDFGWLRNAFILDYMAEELAGRGYTQGIISSRDGCTRSLGGDVGPVERSLYRWDGERAVETGRQEMDTPVNAAAINGFPLGGDDGQAYVNQSALLRGALVQGRTEGYTETVILYSQTEDCVGLALKIIEDIQ